MIELRGKYNNAKVFTDNSLFLNRGKKICKLI